MAVGMAITLSAPNGTTVWAQMNSALDPEVAWCTTPIARVSVDVLTAARSDPGRDVNRKEVILRLVSKVALELGR